MVRDKFFYRSLLSLLLPITLQTLFSYAVQLIDGVMVASLGDTAIAAVNLGMQQYNVFTYIVYGFSTGAAVLISQCWGRNDTETIQRIIRSITKPLIVISFLYSVSCAIFSKQIMSFYTREEDVILAGSQYLVIAAFSYFFNSLSKFYVAIVKAVENARLSMIVFLASFLTSLAMNFLLIEGRFGFPALGVRGAAISTLIARIVELVICLVYNAKFEDRIGLSVGEMISGKAEKAILQEYAKISLPVVIEEMLWGIATSLRAAITGNVGATFVTAISTSESLKQIAMVLTYSLAEVATILIAKAAGSGDLQYSKKVGNTFTLLGFASSALGCVFMLLVRKPFLLLYPNISAESSLLTSRLIRLSAFMALARGTEYVLYIGVHRGAGDTRFAMFFDIAPMFLVSIPLGYLAAFVWKMNPVVVFFFIWCDTFIKDLVSLPRILRGKYIKQITFDDTDGAKI